MASQQQQQKLALPPQQTEADAAAEKEPVGSGEQREETPMEQETPEGEPKPNAEDTSEKEEKQDAVGHAKMPEHPGRDSDSDDDAEESGQKQES